MRRGWGKKPLLCLNELEEPHVAWGDSGKLRNLVKTEKNAGIEQEVEGNFGIWNDYGGRLLAKTRSRKCDNRNN